MAVDDDPEAAPPGENGPAISEDDQEALLLSSTLLDHSAKAIPLVWLRCIETNQGCVNCIEMDPRRRCASAMRFLDALPTPTHSFLLLKVFRHWGLGGSRDRLQSDGQRSIYDF